MNDVALCFAALEMIAREAPAARRTARREDIRTRILAPVRLGLNAEERAIRQGAADILNAVRARR